MGDRGFTKTDMERIGVFQEMGYATIGDKYKGGMPSKCTLFSLLSHCYFRHLKVKKNTLKKVCPWEGGGGGVKQYIHRSGEIHALCTLI